MTKILEVTLRIVSLNTLLGDMSPCSQVSVPMRAKTFELIHAVYY